MMSKFVSADGCSSPVIDGLEGPFSGSAPGVAALGIEEWRSSSADAVCCSSICCSSDLMVSNTSDPSDVGLLFSLDS